MKQYYYYTYKITCTEGDYKDCFYFGKHKTTNLDDNYKGSGKKLKEYYEKFPAGYKKEIISFYNSQEELDEAESKIISKHLNTPKCLNLCTGTFGLMANETKKIISEKLKDRTFIHKDGVTRHIKKEQLNYYLSIGWIIGADKNYVSQQHKENISKSLCGRHLTDEHKKHISESVKNKNNWTKDRIWIHNEKQRKLIYKNDLQKYLSNGYTLGFRLK